MNIDTISLKRAYTLAAASDKVDTRRLARALELVTGTICTIGLRRLDDTHYHEYMVPGKSQPWYVIRTETASGKPVLSGCQCQDRRRDKSRWCKHMLCVALIIRAREFESELTPRIMSLNDHDVYRAKMLKALYPYED